MRSNSRRCSSGEPSTAELNTYWVALFGLRNIFIAFFTSCWMGALKPSRRIYERALEIAQAAGRIVAVH